MTAKRRVTRGPKPENDIKAIDLLLSKARLEWMRADRQSIREIDRLLDERLVLMAKRPTND